MSSREAILGRVREALRTGNRPESLLADSEPDNGITAAGQVLPMVPADFEGQAELFSELSIALKTEFLSSADEKAAKGQLSALVDREKWESLAFTSNQQLERLLEDIKIPKSSVDAGMPISELEKVSLGVTGCDALIAQTGGVLLSARSGGGRALSVLPPHHLVIASARQLVPDLPAAFELLERKYAPDYPSFVGFIMGPSRTGDIERILVLGAHGPRKLTVMLIDEESQQ